MSQTNPQAVLDSLPPARKLRAEEFLRSVRVANLRGNRHRDFKADSKIYPLGAKVLKRTFGGDYKRIVPHFFELVDDNFSKSRGTCKAYRILSRTEDIADALIKHPPKSEKPQPGEDNVFAPVLQREALSSLASSPRLQKADVLVANYLLARSHDNGDGTVSLFERYSTKKHSRRLFANGISLQNTSKVIRHRILSGLDYQDVDIVNAHPVLLNQATEGEFHALSRYVENRNGELSEVASKLGVSTDRAKGVFRALTCGASCKPGKLTELVGKQVSSTPAMLFEFSKDARKAGRALIPEYEGDGICDIVPTFPQKISAILQHIEAKILDSCLAYHATNGGAVRVLLHDGYLFQGDAVKVKGLEKWVGTHAGWCIASAES